MKKSYVLALGTIMLSGALLTACGGGGGSSTPAAATISTGVFSDSLVEGLTYVSGSTTGKTDAAGTFRYEQGQSVTFKVGDIVIATVTPKAYMTPVSLVTGATDETHPTVSNIAKFLQSIDNDNNPANGIQISAAADLAAKNRTLNFAQAVGVYDVDANVIAAYLAITGVTTAGVHAGVTTANAQIHLRDNLLTRLAGVYTGTYIGTLNGTYTVTISTSGVITGSGLESGGTTFTVTGTVASNNTTNFAAGYAGGAAFAGSINGDTGVISGTWAGSPQSGTYTGIKQ